jgi:hypothetical protein
VTKAKGSSGTLLLQRPIRVSENIITGQTRKGENHMALTTGVWNINGNGFEGQLDITSVDAQGNLNGTAFGDQIRGFWDENAQKITFLRIANGADPSTLQIYTGYHFQNPQIPGEGHRTITHTLAGFFEVFSNPGARLFGWFATIPVMS